MSTRQYNPDKEHVTKDLKEGINFAQTAKNHPSIPHNWKDRSQVLIQSLIGCGHECPYERFVEEG